MRRIDTPDELFAAGDPATSTKGTPVRNWWLNTLQEELAGVVEGFGNTLAPEDNGQLFETLVAAGLRAATDTLAGVVELATAAEVLAGTDAVRAITPAALLSGGLGAALAAANGYAVVPVRDATTGARWNLIVQWGSVVCSDNVSTVITFPVAFPTAVYAVNGTWNGATPGLGFFGTCQSPSLTQFLADGWSNSTTRSAMILGWIAIGR